MSKVIVNNREQILELVRKLALYTVRSMHTKGDILKEQGFYKGARGSYITTSKIYARTLGQDSDKLFQVLISQEDIRDELIKD